MASFADRALGIVERTSADAFPGEWAPGVEMTRGFLWAMSLDGVPVLAFETSPGSILFSVAAPDILDVRKPRAGLNVMLEVDVKGDNHEEHTLTLVGPRGRMKRIFDFLGWVL